MKSPNETLNEELQESTSGAKRRRIALACNPCRTRKSRVSALNCLWPTTSVTYVYAIRVWLITHGTTPLFLVQWRPSEMRAL